MPRVSPAKYSATVMAQLQRMLRLGNHGINIAHSKSHRLLGVDQQAIEEEDDDAR